MPVNRSPGCESVFIQFETAVFTVSFLLLPCTLVRSPLLMVPVLFRRLTLVLSSLVGDVPDVGVSEPSGAET